MMDAKKAAAQKTDQMPRGRYPVGCCDLEWAKFGPNTSVNIHGSTHLVGRLYYPCARQPGVTYHPMPWLSDSRYVEGYVEFLFWQSTSWRMALLKQMARGIGYWESSTLHVHVLQGAPLAESPTPFPVVLFSHGVGSNRSTYSLLAADIASRGAVVMCVEHVDGTACGAQLAYDMGWRWFDGRLGNLEARYRKTAYRVAELRTALMLLTHMHAGTVAPASPSDKGSSEKGVPSDKGDDKGGDKGGDRDAPPKDKGAPSEEGVEGEGASNSKAQKQTGTAAQGAAATAALLPFLRLSHGHDATSLLRGRLDLGRVVAMGHSYGGATAAAFAAERPDDVSCCIALDPWWPAVSPSHPLLGGGVAGGAKGENKGGDEDVQGCPLTCIYSDEWTTADALGERKCGWEQHTGLMGRAGLGGGMLALAPVDTQHNACSDIPPLFADNMGWFLKHLGFAKGQVTPLQQLLRVVNGALQAVAFHTNCPALAPTERDWQAAGQPAGGGSEATDKEQPAGVVEHGGRVCVPLSKGQVQAVAARFEACTSVLEFALPT